MASTFFGIEIAKTGLFISQKSLNLTSHNIANAGTEGYTRQRLITESIDPHGVYVRFSLMDKGRVGGGVRVQTLERIRDSFIDKEIRRENANGGKLGVLNDQLVYIDSIFNETGEGSISKAYEDFINSLKSLQENPASEALRTNVRSTTNALTQILHLQYAKLEELQESMNESMSVTTDRVNDLLSMLADYNRQILRYEISGEKANDLRDKRDLLLDELSTLIDIEHSEMNDKLTVKMQNSTQVLISHTDVATLEAVADPVTGMYDIMITQFGSATPAALEYTSGEMEGYRIIRDGDTSDEYGAPYIMAQLDYFAQELVTRINTIHQLGYSHPGGGTASINGRNFFEIEAGLSAAKGIKIADAINNDVFLIACSSVQVTGAGDSPDGNNLNLLDILTLLGNENHTAIDGTSFDGYIRTILSELGSQGAKIETLNATQLSVVANLLDRRESVSGVSIDEEVTLMLQFQHMYAANSRMLTALDEALDVLINRTGVVGL